MLSQIDFKLLLCLSSLLKHHNVSLAADEMHISQPAMSRALAKLRTLFSDPLLVRTSKGMEPTRRALSLVQPLHSTLDQLTVLLSNQDFTPLECERNFRLHMTSYITQAHLPHIAEAFYRGAPNAQLEIINLGEKSLLDHSAQNIDLVLCSQAMHIPEHFHQLPVGQESMRCFMAKNHPLANTELTLDNFLAYPHIIVTLGGGPNIPLESSLSKIGRVRKVGLRVPHYVGALEVLSRTNMLFNSSPFVADRFSEQFSIMSQPLPVRQDSLNYVLVWPPTVHKDPA
ncbi:MAG: LysR family transcriptional regulator, partial [Algicola sp.]|nr:LysR family transcriptional regulator [Algicola sp.]